MDFFHKWLIPDSDGYKSWHVTLAIPLLLLASIWFLAGGVAIEVGTVKVTTATKSGSDYLLFVGPWLGALGWREHRKGKFGGYGGKDGSSSQPGA